MPPGGRQFGTVADFVRYYAPALGRDADVVLRLAEEKQRRKHEERPRLDAEAERLAAVADRRGVLLASHGDGSAADAAWAVRLVGAGCLLAAIPSWSSYRQPVPSALRS